MSRVVHYSLSLGMVGWREVFSKQLLTQVQALQGQCSLKPLCTTIRQLHYCLRTSAQSVAAVPHCKKQQQCLPDPVKKDAFIRGSWHQFQQACPSHRHTSAFHTNCGRLSSDLVTVNIQSQMYNRLIESVPGGIQMAFAYGSGVFQQEGHASMKENMLDFIFVVDDPHTWHIQNIKRNPRHYSFLRHFGARAVAHVQEFGAGIYFNTLVAFEDRIIKYGVVSTDRLIVDLLDWDTLYVSGRLHKPIRLFVVPSNPDLIQAMQLNLQSAMHAALLMLPEDFCEEALYMTIAGLSYNGDFRMVVGEDRNKVSNIVRPNMQHFRTLYSSILEHEEHVHWHPQQGRLEQDPNHITQFHHLHLLPKTVLLLLQENRTRPGSHPDLEEVLKIYANSSHCDDTVARCISHIVWRSSLSQSSKTILTAGARKSVVYTLKKLKKMWKGRPKREVTM